MYCTNRVRERQQKNSHINSYSRNTRVTLCALTLCIHGDELQVILTLKSGNIYSTSLGNNSIQPDDPHCPFHLSSLHIQIAVVLKVRLMLHTLYLSLTQYFLCIDLWIVIFSIKLSSCMLAATWFILGLLWDFTTEACQYVWETRRWRLKDGEEHMIQETKRSKSSLCAFLFDYSGKSWRKMIKQLRKTNVSIAHGGQAGSSGQFCGNTQFISLIFFFFKYFKARAQEQWCVEHILLRLRGGVFCWPAVHCKGRENSIPQLMENGLK